MSKQTAIEWLASEMFVIDWTDPHLKSKLKQAKAMEKEQIKEAYIYAFGERDEIDKNLFFNSLALEYNEKKFNEYFNETYGGEE